jgi:hypothetical protein
MSDAVTQLGPGHPLSLALARRACLARQAAAVAAYVLVDLAVGHRAPLHGPVIGAGLVVLAVLVLALAVSHWSVHERALDVIIAGYEDLPVPAIVRARRRLASPRRRRALARSLEQAVVDTRAWSGIDFSGEVEQVTRLLRGHHPSRVRGVALADRLVRDGAALPVGSTGREILRRELGRIRYELTA